MSTTEAHEKLKGTHSKDKHEMLFSEFNINYTKEPGIYRRGTIYVRVKVDDEEEAKSPKLNGQEEDGNEADAEHNEKEESPEAEEEKKEDTKEETKEEAGQEKQKGHKVKMKVIGVHEDLVEKEAFYEKYDLNTLLESGGTPHKAERPSTAQKQAKQEK